MTVNPEAAGSAAAPTVQSAGATRNAAAGRMRCGSWGELQAPAAQVRRAVFVQEQQIAEELEWDEADQPALHVVVFSEQGDAVGTGRLLAPEPGVAQIGRLAVLRPARRTGIGALLVRTLMEQARQRGDRRVILNAQCAAIPFYVALGFQPNGEIFQEAGIDHVQMSAPL